jgi:hypothetical protein
MGWKTKDGPYVSATKVLRVECDKCGVVEITRWPCNDRETEDLIRKHAAKHGGLAPRY